MYTREDLRDTVLQGNCLDVMEHFPNHCMDMVLCDLPYGRKHHAWDTLIDLEALWTAYRRIIKPTGVLVFTAAGLFTAQLMCSNPRWFKYTLCWEKSAPTGFLNAKKQPLRKHEDICVFYHKTPTYHPQMQPGAPYRRTQGKTQTSNYDAHTRTTTVNSTGERYPTTMLYFKTAHDEGTAWHPTQKPVALGRYLIRTYSNEGDLVLDNTCGSGSFLVAAREERRSFCGIEQGEACYAACCERLAQQKEHA